MALTTLHARLKCEVSLVVTNIRYFFFFFLRYEGNWEGGGMRVSAMLLDLFVLNNDHEELSAQPGCPVGLYFLCLVGAASRALQFNNRKTMSDLKVVSLILLHGS